MFLRSTMFIGPCGVVGCITSKIYFFLGSGFTVLTIGSIWRMYFEQLKILPLLPFALLPLRQPSSLRPRVLVFERWQLRVGFARGDVLASNQSAGLKAACLLTEASIVPSGSHRWAIRLRKLG